MTRACRAVRGAAVAKVARELAILAEGATRADDIPINEPPPRLCAPAVEQINVAKIATVAN